MTQNARERIKNKRDASNYLSIHSCRIPVFPVSDVITSQRSSADLFKKARFFKYFLNYNVIHLCYKSFENEKSLQLCISFALFSDLNSIKWI